VTLHSDCTITLPSYAGAQTFHRQTELIRVLGNEEAAVPCEAFYRPETLARVANRARQRQRPADPQSLDFNLDTDFFAT